MTETSTTRRAATATPAGPFVLFRMSKHGRGHWYTGTETNVSGAPYATVTGKPFNAARFDTIEDAHAAPGRHGFTVRALSAYKR